MPGSACLHCAPDALRYVYYREATVGVVID
jgi:hypothetical protein